MLSVEVVYAIRILTELENRKKETGRDRCAGQKDIFGESIIGDKLIKRVLLLLIHKRYIEYRSGKYISRTSLNEITVYDLIKTIHPNRVCICEALPMDLKGEYLYMPEFEKLREAEEKIESVLMHKFQKMCLSDYVALMGKAPEGLQ